MTTPLRLLLLSALLIALAACDRNELPTEADDVPLPPEATPAPVAMTAFPEPYDFGNPELTLKSFKNGAWDFDIVSEQYRLGVATPDADNLNCANSEKGQHIHLIYNNDPYLAKYESEFQEDAPDGEHYITAFLSRSYHLSLKAPASGIGKKVTVTNNSITKMEDITEPMLIYSRPKGTYTGKDTENVLLDFYLHNVDLSSGNYSVQVMVNGEYQFSTGKWQPYYLQNLPMGKNTVTLTLLDGDGNVVDTPLNPVSRDFTLMAETPVN